MVIRAYQLDQMSIFRSVMEGSVYNLPEPTKGKTWI